MFGNTTETWKICWTGRVKVVDLGELASAVKRARKLNELGPLETG